MNASMTAYGGPPRQDPSAGATPPADPWAAAAARAAEAVVAQAGAVSPAAARIVLVAAHGGAGASTWAQILSAQDADCPEGHGDARVVLVTRASLVGVDAAKRVLADHLERVSCLLVVPAAPGRVPALVRNEMQVLSGAVPVVTAPWAPKLLLRRPTECTPEDVPAKPLTRLRSDLETLTQGDETP